MLKAIGRAGQTILLALTGASALSQPPAAEPSALAARWHLDGATSRCVLTRRLTGTPVPATFILRTLPGSGRYDIIMASTGFPDEIRRLRNRPEISLSLGPDIGSAKLPATSVDLPHSLGQGLAMGPLPSEFLSAFGRTTTLSLGDGEGRTVASWNVPASARAAEAVAYCESEKLAEWGADPAGLAPGATRPEAAGDPQSWLTTRQLGISDALASVAYTAVFRLGIDTDGRVKDCTLLESAGNADLSRGCRILSRSARFSPARDSAGNPVRSVAVHVVDVRSDNQIRFIGG